MTNLNKNIGILSIEIENVKKEKKNTSEIKFLWMMIIEEMIGQPEDRQIIIPSEDRGDYVKMPTIQCTGITNGEDTGQKKFEGTITKKNTKKPHNSPNVAKDINIKGQ